MKLILFDPSDATSSLDGPQMRTNVQKSNRTNEVRFPTDSCATSPLPPPPQPSQLIIPVSSESSMYRFNNTQLKSVLNVHQLLIPGTREELLRCRQIFFGNNRGQQLLQTKSDSFQQLHRQKEVDYIYQRWWGKHHCLCTFFVKLATKKKKKGKHLLVINVH